VVKAILEEKRSTTCAAIAGRLAAAGVVNEAAIGPYWPIHGRSR